MKAVRIREHGGPEILTYEDAPEPKIQADEVLIKVKACALNHPLRIALRLPGRSRVIMSTGWLVWQRQDARTTRYHSGCRFVGLSAVNRACIERTLQGVQS